MFGEWRMVNSKWFIPSPFTGYSLTNAVRQLAPATLVDDLVNLLVGQVLVVVEADLHHRRRAAGAEALDFGERELTVLGRLSGLDAESLHALRRDAPRAHDLAREGLADL